MKKFYTLIFVLLIACTTPLEKPVATPNPLPPTPTMPSPIQIQIGPIEVYDMPTNEAGLDYTTVEKHVHFSMPTGFAFENNTDISVGIVVDPFDGIVNYLGYKKIDNYWVIFEFQKQEESIIFVSQKTLLNDIQTTFTISNNDEERMNAGLIAGLYLVTHWLNDPEALKQQVFNAESYGLMLTAILTNQSYDTFSQNIQEAGRQTVSLEEWNNSKKELTEANVIAEPLFFP